MTDYGHSAERWAGPVDAVDTPVAPRPWSARRTVTLGMPQLDGCGLSETWLQKTCADVHWRGLSHSLGRPSERWFDASGGRVYAAFALIRMRAARLDHAQEGQALGIRSRLASVGRSQAWSRHLLATAGGGIGELEMLSVFVGRGEDGSNRSVRRVPMRDQGAPAPAAAQALAERARAWRAQAAHAVLPDAPEPMRFKPCPRSDFNGAGLVYFASFTAWADRALFGWGLVGAADHVVERECLFLGNLDIGYTAEVCWRGLSEVDGRRCLEVLVHSPSDGRLLAVVRTTLAG